MSRPQKIHPPIKATFKQIISAVAAGSTPAARKAAKKAAAQVAKPPAPTKKV